MLRSVSYKQYNHIVMPPVPESQCGEVHNFSLISSFMVCYYEVLSRQSVLFSLFIFMVNFYMMLFLWPFQFHKVINHLCFDNDMF